jgi:hypothetical protein
LDSLRKVGIKVILSTILLFDFHTKKNIWEDVEGHLALRPAFSQFSFYAPFPGSPLHARMKQEGRLLSEIPLEDCHAFKQPWFIHPEFSLAEAEKIQEKAYLDDFYRLGPSIVRLIRDELEGYVHMKGSANPGLQERARYFAQSFSQYRAVLCACEYLVPTPEMKEQARDVRLRLEAEAGRINILENVQAAGLYSFGRLREFRTRHFGDAIQPATRVTHYHR